MERTVASLFCGAGGLDIGFDMAGFKTLWANDFNADACDTHRAWSGAEVVWGDVAKVDSDSIPDIDVMLGGFPCFPADTLIVSKSGYKPIVDIKEGDEVLSHDGKYHPVIQWLDQGEKELYKLDMVGSYTIRATGSHRFWARTRLPQHKWTAPSWISLEQMEQSADSFYIGCPINAESHIPEWKGTTVWQNATTQRHLKTLQMDNMELWYLVGRYLGDGWLRKNQKKGPCRRKYDAVSICCSHDEFEELCSHIPQSFHYTAAREATTSKVLFTSSELIAFFEQFGTGADEKRLPGFCFDLPVSLLQQLLYGYIDSDGSYTKGGIQCTSVNLPLLYDISQCVMKTYHVPCNIFSCQSGYSSHIIQGRTVHQRPSYILRFIPNSSQTISFYDADTNMIWYKVHSVENTHQRERVYDITVEEAHSFVAYNACAHNCQGFSLAGPRRIDDSRNSLYRQYVRILTDKQPIAFVGENVKGLLTMGGGQIMPAIVQAFSDSGYDVHYKLLNAKDYGVPENRERVIIVGLRHDLGIAGFEFPEPSGVEVTLRDAIGDLDAPSDDDVCHDAYSSRYMSRNRKRDWDEVSFTIPAMAKQCPLWPGSPDMVKIDSEHWEFGRDGETRRLSWQEAAAIQTFPEGMEFAGNLDSRYRQIGNAVPCLLGKVVAERLKETLDGVGATQ